MPKTHELAPLIPYLENILARVHWRAPEAERLISWLFAGEEALPQTRGADALALLSQARSTDALAEWLRENADLALAGEGPFTSRDDAAARWARLGDAVDEVRLSIGKEVKDLGARRVEALGERLGLSQTDVAVLQALARYATDPAMRNLVDTVFALRHRQRPLVLPERVLACLAGTTPQELRARLEEDSPLVRFGLAMLEGGRGIGIAMHVRRLNLVSDGTGIRPSWLKRVSPSAFAWKDFECIGEGRTDAETLLVGAIKRAQRGVNLLVHGPADSGKAGFCAALCERTEIDLFRVRPTVAGADDGWSDQARKLLTAQLLLRKRGGAALLAEGMDGLLAGGMLTERLRWMLGDTPVPTLWTVTDASRIDRAALKRMAYAIRMPMDADLWARSWLKALVRRGVAITLRDARLLAQDYGAPPGAVVDAAAAAGGLGLVARSVQSLRPLLARRRREATAPASDRFDNRGTVDDRLSGRTPT